MRHLFALAFASLAFTAVGCAVDGTSVTEPSDPSDTADLEAVASTSDELRVPVLPLDVRKSGAARGLTLITSAHQYRRFFRASPPRSVDFKRHAVVHFSVGEMPTGGHEAKITGAQRVGRVLTIETFEQAPGTSCMVTMAFTNPQATVRIAKPPAAVIVRQVTAQAVRECATEECPSGGSLCAAVCSGQQMPDVPAHCPVPMCKCAPLEPVCPDVSNYCDLACANQPLPEIPGGCAVPGCVCALPEPIPSL